MIHIDQYDLAFTTESPSAAAAYVDGLDFLLANRVEARQCLVRALELDPAFALARATLVFLQRLQRDSRSLVGQILVAVRDANGATRREQQVVEVLRRAMVGDVAGASRLASAHLADFPRDVVMLRQHILLTNSGGGAHRKAAIAAELGQLAPEFGGDPWFLGAHSFALSEVGEVASAVQLANRGLADRPDHNVLAHAMAHTYFEAGDDAGGCDFVDGWLRDHGRDVFNVGHMTWHLALTHLALADPASAVALYDAQKRVEPWRMFVTEDAISLLWRLQLRGVQVTDEWDGVLPQEAPAGITRPFEVAHIAFALAAIEDHDRLQQLASQMQLEAEAHPDKTYRFLPPLIAALLLVARGRWNEAGKELEAAADDFRRLGGSNEQQAIIDETIAYASRQPVR